MDESTKQLIQMLGPYCLALVVLISNVVIICMSRNENNRTQKHRNLERLATLLRVKLDNMNVKKNGADTAFNDRKANRENIALLKKELREIERQNTNTVQRPTVNTQIADLKADIQTLENEDNELNAVYQTTVTGLNDAVAEFVGVNKLFNEEFSKE